jgi:NADH dehydrogenase
MEISNVLLVGGSGFVGSHIAHLLVGRGCRLTVPTRRREQAKHLLPLPTVDVVEADVNDDAALRRLMAGQDAVVNLAGILHSRNGSPYGPDFAQAHVELPRRIVAAAKSAGVRRLLHMSALRADTGGPSQYLRSKADGETAVRAAGDALAWTIFQPSVIFGPGDSFLNMFASLARAFPVLPLASPDARFQPVFVEDVAHAFADSLERPESHGQTYPLCGPKVYTLRQLVDYVTELIGCPRLVIGLPDGLSYLQAMMLEFAPGKTLMSRDNYRSMKQDSVCPAHCTLPFGRAATTLEAVAPVYLAHQEPRASYYPFREKARR